MAARQLQGRTMQQLAAGCSALPSIPRCRSCSRHVPLLVRAAVEAPSSLAVNPTEPTNPSQPALLSKPEFTAPLLRRPQARPQTAEEANATPENPDVIIRGGRSLFRRKPKIVTFDDKGPKGPDFQQHPVQASGREVPPPLTSFNRLNTKVSGALMHNIAKLGFVRPTTIQQYATPAVLNGRDLIAIAPPGTGKTVAYLLPILSQLMHRTLRPTKNVAYPAAVVLVPNRELAVQVHGVVKQLIRETHLRALAVPGGEPMAQQKMALRGGQDLIVATPARLLGLLHQGRINLGALSWLVLDEVDLLLADGYEPLLRRIVLDRTMPPPGVRQTLMFGTLLPSRLHSVAAEFLHDHLDVRVGSAEGSMSVNPQIKQRLILVQPSEKYKACLAYLKQVGNRQVLVFVEGRQRAQELHNYLKHNGIQALSIHSDHATAARDEALNLFHYGVAQVLVATSLAARGLDMPQALAVVNFDLPEEIGEYILRVGRTGRTGSQGKPSEAVSFFTPDDQPLAGAMLDLLQESGQQPPEWLPAMADAEPRLRRRTRAAISGIKFRLIGHHRRHPAAFNTYLLKPQQPSPMRDLHEEAPACRRNWAEVWREAWESGSAAAEGPEPTSSEAPENVPAAGAAGRAASDTAADVATVAAAHQSEAAAPKHAAAIVGSVEELDSPGGRQRRPPRAAAAGKRLVTLRATPAKGEQQASKRQQMLWSLQDVDPGLPDYTPDMEVAVPN